MRLVGILPVAIAALAMAAAAPASSAAAPAPQTRPATRPAVPARPLRVLFIGNSYTSVNDLPTIFRKQAIGAGFPTPLVDSLTPGGRTWQQHLDDPKTLAKIDGGYGPRHLTWDVVVLQEQSQLPAMAEDVPAARAGFLGGAVGLYDRVKQKNPDARVVLYETWARHPDAWRPGGGSDKLPPVGKDAAEMQARLRKWYTFAAEEHIPTASAAARKTDVTVARVGDAWERHYADAGAMRLHADDGSHPSYAGSYLAGLVILRAAYPIDLPPVRERGTLAREEAEHLQQVAAGVGAKVTRDERLGER